MKLYQLEVNLSRSDIIPVGEVGNVEDLAALLSCEQLNQVHKLDVLEGERGLYDVERNQIEPDKTGVGFGFTAGRSWRKK